MLDCSYFFDRDSFYWCYTILDSTVPSLSARLSCHPSVLPMQRFGTILALVCMSSDTEDGKEVLQMLQAEGGAHTTITSQIGAVKSHLVQH